MTRPQIAFLGTGLMGAPMVRRLLAAGFPVTVWNRTAEKAGALVESGATHAETAADAVRDAAIVITMLDSGAVVTEVLFAAGVAAAMAPGATLVDMSSIPPHIARDHAARLEALGIAHLDAPVSGGTVGAAEGTLAIMAGGDPAVYEGAVPVFEAMGRPLRVGPAGAGQLAKLANQTIVGITIGAVAEALVLAERGGADPAAVREAIRGGFAESRILDLHGARMVERDFAPRARVTTQIKDLETILATAAENGVDLPLARATLAGYIALRDGLDGADLDHSALFLQVEAGTPRG
jgi:2-hydroxy-3-oxopropionate reductase